MKVISMFLCRVMMTCSGREYTRHALLIPGPKRAERFLDVTSVKRT
jgi:hypothetical protein